MKLDERKKEIGNAITRERSVEDTRPIYGVGVSDSTQYFLMTTRSVYDRKRTQKSHIDWDYKSRTL